MAEQFWEDIVVTHAQSPNYLAHRFVLENFDAALTEFSDVFEALDTSKPVENLSTPDREELDRVFADWFESFNKPDDHYIVADSSPDLKRKYHLESGNVLNVVMDLCSSCSNPSAALRKCNFFFFAPRDSAFLIHFR